MTNERICSNQREKEAAMLEIIEVKTRKQRKEFVEYPLRLYKGNPYFVPPLYGDEMSMFTDKNVYSKTCDSVYYLAQRDGKTVGRIQGIVQKQYNEINGTKQVRFSRFDCENNEETAKALFDTVETWGRAQGMDTMIGPSGFSDQEREGLLIEGFDYLSTFEEQYNYEYYANLIESCGYVKSVDWLERRLFKTPQQDERLEKFGKRALEKYNLHRVGDGMSKRAFINKYKDGMFYVLDECYKDLYGTVPFTEEMKKQLLDQFMLLLNKDYLMAVCNEKEEVVAFGVCIPGFGRALQKSGGRLTPAGIVRLLKEVKHPKSIDLALIGIMPEYRKSGLTALVITELNNMLNKPGIEYLETNLNLETNTQIQATWKHFDNIQHKRRRGYKKSL